MTFLIGLQRGALRRQRVRGRGRHPRQAGRGRQWPHHRAARSRPMPRSSSKGFVEPGNERVEGPFAGWTGYYASDLRPEAAARHQGDLLSQQSDPARLRAPAAAGRDLPLSRRGSFRPAAREHLRRRACRASPRPGRTRSAPRGSSRGGRSTSAIPATPSRPAISPPCAMSAPIAGATWSWSTTTSTSPISKS